MKASSFLKNELNKLVWNDSFNEILPLFIEKALNNSILYPVNNNFKLNGV